MTGGREADRQNSGMLRRIVALLFALAVIAERASVMPAPLRCLVLRFLRRGELAANSYLCWAARDLGAPLHWAWPKQGSEISSREAALTLAWWLRILAVALRDLPRRGFAIRIARWQWRIELTRAACLVGSGPDRPLAFDTS